jgi:hypothetical protein
MIGGALGGQCLQRLFAGDESATDVQIFLSGVLGGGLGGSLLLILAGSIRQLITRKE